MEPREARSSMAIKKMAQTSMNPKIVTKMEVPRQEKKSIPLSIVIPVLNRAASLKTALRALAHQVYLPQIIVVDDHSAEDVRSTCESFSDTLDLEYLRLSKNAGPAMARNVGIKAANNAIIAFTDSDCIPAPTWSRYLFEYMRDAPTIVAGVGGRVLGTRNDIMSQYMVYHQILEPHPRGWPHVDQYLYLVTANCAYRRRVLQDFGGFDETLKVAGGEDTGLGLRIVKAGFQLHYQQRAIVFHDFTLNAWSFLKTFFRYGRGCEQQASRILPRTIESSFPG